MGFFLFIRSGSACRVFVVRAHSAQERGWPREAGRFRRGPTQGAAANGHARAMTMMVMTVMVMMTVMMTVMMMMTVMWMEMMRWWL